MEPQDYEQLTFYLEASLDLASRSALPGSDEAKKMTVTSGLKCLELSKSCGPLGLLEKMSLGSSIWRSTLRLLTWKVKTTPSGRSYFQLAASKPRTKGTESLLWQTPNVPNGGRVNPPEMSSTGKKPDGCKRQVGLDHQVKMAEGGLWPTPHASSGTGACQSPNKQGAPNLQTAASGQLNPDWVESLMGFPIGRTDLNGPRLSDVSNTPGNLPEL